MFRAQNEYVTALDEHVTALDEHVFALDEHVLSANEHVTMVSPHNVRDDPVAANKLNIKTDVKCDLGPSHCYVARPACLSGKRSVEAFVVSSCPMLTIYSFVASELLAEHVPHWKSLVWVNKVIRSWAKRCSVRTE